MDLHKMNREIYQHGRMKFAIEQLEKRGFVIINKGESDNMIMFDFKDKPVYFFPFTGWHSGKTIKDGRGIKNLLKQLDNA